MRYRKHPSWTWLAELSSEQILLEKVREFSEEVAHRVSELEPLKDDGAQSTSHSDPPAQGEKSR